MAHWSLSEREPNLISIPTATGKTAVAMAAPFLGAEPARRVLVLAPARQIRQQLVGNFASYTQLQRLGVLPATTAVPSVFEMSGRLTDWSVLDSHDVVVALPNSISPATTRSNSGRHQISSTSSWWMSAPRSSGNLASCARLLRCSGAAPDGNTPTPGW
jgi:superfamily II DNA or RNA helicase